MAVGLRFTIERQSETDGIVRKVIFLATSAAGNGRTKMKKLKRGFRKASFDMQEAAQRWAAEKRRVEMVDPLSDKYDSLIDKQQKAFDLVRTSEDAATDLAEELVEMSLRRNYGKDEIAEILEIASMRDLLAMVTVINTGELPADFFPSGDRQQKPTSTSEPGDSPDTSSASTDTAKGK